MLDVITYTYSDFSLSMSVKRAYMFAFATIDCMPLKYGIIYLNWGRLDINMSAYHYVYLGAREWC